MKQQRIPSLIIKGVVVLTLKINRSIHESTLKNQSKQAISSYVSNKLLSTVSIFVFWSRGIFISMRCVAWHFLVRLSFSIFHFIQFSQVLRFSKLSRFYSINADLQTIPLAVFFRSILSDDKQETLHHALAISLLSI